MFKPIRTFIKTPITIWSSQVQVTWSEPDHYQYAYETNVSIDENTFRSEIFDMSNFKVALEKVEYDSLLFRRKFIFKKRLFK